VVRYFGEVIHQTLVSVFSVSLIGHIFYITRKWETSYVQGPFVYSRSVWLGLGSSTRTTSISAAGSGRWISFGKFQDLVFWDTMPSKRDDSCQRFGGSWCSMVTSWESRFAWQPSAHSHKPQCPTPFTWLQLLLAPPPLWLQKHTGLTRTRLRALFRLDDVTLRSLMLLASVAGDVLELILLYLLWNICICPHGYTVTILTEELQCCAGGSLGSIETAFGCQREF